MDENLKSLPLEKVHTALGARMVPFTGFSMPIQYTSIIEEHFCVREHVGIFDATHMGEIIIEGEHAIDLLQKVTNNDVSKLFIGKAQYTCIMNEDGGIIDDAILYKKEESTYLFVVNASNIDKDFAWLNKHNEWDVSLENISSDICLLAVQGPKSIELLQELTSVEISQIKKAHFTEGTIANIPNVLISNTGYTGEIGFELYVQKTDAEKLWNSIFEKGTAYNIQPIGLGARDTLRLEKGYALYGNDISDETTPIEAGLGWVTKFSKPFLGDEVLKKQKEEGVTKKFVGFKLLERGIPRTGYTLCDVNENEIGTVTSGGQSPILKNGIGLGYVQAEHSTPGTEICIEIRKKNIKAQVVSLPFV